MTKVSCKDQAGVQFSTAPPLDPGKFRIDTFSCGIHGFNYYCHMKISFHDPETNRFYYAEGEGNNWLKLRDKLIQQIVQEGQSYNGQ